MCPYSTRSPPQSGRPAPGSCPPPHCCTSRLHARGKVASFGLRVCRHTSPYCSAASRAARVWAGACRSSVRAAAAPPACRLALSDTLVRTQFEAAQSHADDDATLGHFFLHLWSLKESFLKARGDGLQMSPGRASFTLDHLLPQCSALPRHTE